MRPWTIIVCVEKDPGITQGRSYGIEGYSHYVEGKGRDMVHVRDDTGRVAGHSAEKFELIPSDGSILAYEERQP